MNEFINDKVLPKVMGFINLKPMQALKDGLLFAMPLMIVGSVFLLMAEFPYTPIKEWFASVGLTPILNQAYGSSFNIMALVAVSGIAYTYAKNEGYEPMSAGVIGLSCFLLLQPSTLKIADGSEVGVILKDWTAGKGMICAILVGLIVGWIYTIFMKKDIRIKMPAGVPDGVANSFNALIPAAVLIGGAAIIYAIFKMGLDTTFVEIIYQIIQTPLQGLTDSLGGVIIMCFLVPFLWFFGVHGSTIVGGVMGPILQANTAANQALLDAGKELTLANGAHIVTQQFLDQFITVTGAGLTLGVVVYMAFFARSSQFKEIGKISVVPGVFNINEPVLFGTPVVLNPIMAIPFIAMPVIAGLIEYFAIYTGLCPMYGGVILPWTTPPVISGFLIGGWRSALLQVVILVTAFFVYLPFIKKADSLAYQQESEAQK